MATQSTQLGRAAIEDQVAETVRQLLTELGSPAAASALDHRGPDTHLERDLGLGSLERVELLLRLGNALGVRLPDQVVAEADTVGDVVSALLRESNSGNARPAEIFSAQLAGVRRHPDTPSEAARPARDFASAETLNEVLERHARLDPRRPQIYLRLDDGGTSLITYGELYDRAQLLARGLAVNGLGPRETVAIMLPTSPEFFYTFYGTLLAGGVPVPIYPPFRADRIEEYAARQAAILRNAEARLLVTFRQAEGVARLLKPRVPSLTGVLNATRLVESPPAAFPESPHVRRLPPRGDDLAFLQYTSGSTGEPKGVMLTHSNLLANIRAIASALEVGPNDVGVSWLPLYHDMGLIGAWLTMLYSGLPLAALSPLAFLTRPERWLWAVHHHRGTLAAAPNFAYELCVRKIADRDIEGLDLSSWRGALNGAEPVNPETLERFTARFSRYGFRPESMLPVYGLAENSVALAVPPVGRGPRIDHIERVTFENEGRAVPINREAISAAEADNGTEGSVLSFVSVGPAVPQHEIRIVDPDGRDVPERTEGQLWFRGPSATRGYFRNAEATAAIMRGAGWVDSGDRAYLADGEVYITGRVKDIIIKAGRNIYPHEVEEIAGGVEGVRKGCVVAFGALDERAGTERLVVVAEARQADSRSRTQIAARVSEQIAEALGIPPDVVEIIPAQSIPKTSSGKLRRNETKQLYLAGKLASRKPPAWVQVARVTAVSGTHAARSGIRRAFELVYGLWAAIAFMIFLLPTWALAYLAPSRRSAARVTQIGTRIFFYLLGCPIRIVGQENIAAGGPFVFVSNHTSYFDVLLFLAAFKMPYRFVSKKEVASWPFIGTFIRKRGDFAFDRDARRARLDQAEALEQALRDGDSLLIFPEGTFTPAAGVRPFQLGAFKAAVSTGRPVIPVAVRGAREILRDETVFPKPGSITLTFCPPLVPDGTPGRTWKEMLRLRDASRQAISRDCGEHLL